MVTAPDKQSAFNEAQCEVINMLSCLGDEADFRALKSVWEDSRNTPRGGAGKGAC